MNKVCRHCKRTFEPARPLQATCGLRCALAEVRVAKKAKKASERDLTRVRREALKTIPERIKEAQIAFNQFIRMRDAELPCISCGNPPPGTELHAGRDAGHYRSTGNASHLRFDERNCNAQCVKCNQWGAGRVTDYRIGLIDRIGSVAVLDLESDNASRKWSHDELIAIKDKYKTKIKELTK